MHLSRSLITDIQYADVDNGWNYQHTAQRYYRNAFKLMKQAIKTWMDGEKNRVQFAVNLGDLIDGKNKRIGNSQAALEKIKAAWEPFEQYVGPVHHLLGNHELYNFPQSIFDKELRWKNSSTTHYSFTIVDPATSSLVPLLSSSSASVCFIVLNCYGITSLGRSQDDAIYQCARQRLISLNPNTDLNSSLNMKGRKQRFVEYNGAIDDTQLEWLDTTLLSAQERREHVIIFTHIPLHPRSCLPQCLLWNYQEVLDCLWKYSCVRVVFSGHSHWDGYVQERGVHFVVCDAILECAPNETAHAIVDVYDDRVVVNGYGKIPSRVLRFPVQTDSVEADEE